MNIKVLTTSQNTPVAIYSDRDQAYLWIDSLHRKTIKYVQPYQIDWCNLWHMSVDIDSLPEEIKYHYLMELLP